MIVHNPTYYQLNDVFLITKSNKFAKSVCVVLEKFILFLQDIKIFFVS